MIRERPTWRGGGWRHPANPGSMSVMRRPSRALRLTSLAFAAVQLALPAAATLADARLELATRNLPAHVEHVRDGCARVHPADCALCQFLAFHVAGVARVSLARSPADQAMPTQSQVKAPRASVVTHLPHQRAPPTILL
jgi:hypothetical protein